MTRRLGDVHVSFSVIVQIITDAFKIIFVKHSKQTKTFIKE